MSLYHGKKRKVRAVMNRSMKETSQPFTLVVYLETNTNSFTVLNDPLYSYKL